MNAPDLWWDFYINAIERLGLDPEDAAWDADTRMAELTPPKGESDERRC